MHSLLKKIVHLNQQVLELVDSSEWENILLLSQERDQYIKKYFAINPIPDDPSMLSKIVKEIAASDQKVVQLITNEKKQLIDQGLSLKKSHSAIQQYRMTQTG